MLRWIIWVLLPGVLPPGVLLPGLLLPGLVAGAILSRPAPAQAAAACAASVAFTTPDAGLPQVAAALKAHRPVDILGVGSATMVGDQPGTPHDSAFPYRMVAALHTALPDVAFGLTLRGGRGMTAEDMLPMLDAALASHHFTLVLWQTGTVEAVRGQDPDDMLTALQTGIQHARDAGADVVLIDPQFSRFLRANTDLDPYEMVLRQVAIMPGVVLFHRYDVMQSWADAGGIDLEHVTRANRAEAMAQLNACLGETLARFVLTGAGIPPQ